MNRPAVSGAMLLSAVLAWLTAQIVKTILYAAVNHKLDWQRLFGDGGMLASILQTAGYTTGLYTSPFISRFHERMQVNGVPISDEELATITEAVEPLAESMEDHPTEFELVSCIAFEYFMEHSCDIVVLEVGMRSSTSMVRGK